MNSVRSTGSANPAEKKLRLDSIDILRGLAALSVAFYHIWGHDGSYGWASNAIVRQTQDPTFFTYLISPLRWGYLGVSMFLVLSGFCIHLPFARKKIDHGNYGFNGPIFFTRRIWRLYPAYFVAVIVTAGVLKGASFFQGLHIEGHFPIPGFWDVISHLSMLHGFFENQFYSIASVFWSLSLEFQLYIAYPVFLLAFRKFGTGRAVLLFILLSLIWRYFAMHYLGGGLISIAAVGPYASMGCLPARMAEWLLGAFLAEVFIKNYSADTPKKKFSTMRIPFATLSIICFASAIITTLSQELWVITDPLFGLAFAMLIAAIILPDKGFVKIKDKGYITKLFIKLGVISYSFYLIHSQFGWLVSLFVPSKEGDPAAFVIRLAALGISLLPILLFFQWFEKPFLSPPKMGSKLFPYYQKLGGLFGVR
ncbi:MAG: acyltransferase [Ignavibacteriota bacterium]